MTLSSWLGSQVYMPVSGPVPVEMDAHLWVRESHHLIFIQSDHPYRPLIARRLQMVIQALILANEGRGELQNLLLRDLPDRLVIALMSSGILGTPCADSGTR